MLIVHDLDEIKKLIQPICMSSSIKWIKDAPNSLSRLSFYYSSVGLILCNEGFALFTVSNSHLYLSLIFVREEFRGRGFGHKIFDELIRVATMHGKSRITWAVERDNVDAIHFYERLGYRPNKIRGEKYRYVANINSGRSLVELGGIIAKEEN